MNTWMISFQNSNSPVLDLLIMFHDLAMTFITTITALVLLTIMSTTTNMMTNRFLLQGNTIEMIWTIAPIMILVTIALPSLKILYMIDTTFPPKITLKTIGHQWYWSYEYPEFSEMEFDSFMIPTESLEMNEFRLLDVDNRCVLPMKMWTRVITTSTDVIHAWTIPSLGIKMDSTPGRLNQLSTQMFRPGIFYGQCSEICGMNHSFMPIVIESTTTTNFLEWISSFHSK